MFNGGHAHANQPNQAENVVASRLVLAHSQVTQMNFCTAAFEPWLGAQKEGGGGGGGGGGTLSLGRIREELL